jgi:hypothetical protein
MPEKLLVLRNCTLATAESDTMFKYAVYMDQRHPSISKQVVVIWALKA